LCFQNAYHGDTAGAMSICDPVNSMHSQFKGYLLEQYSREIPRSDEDAAELEAFLGSKKDRLAGIIIEPLVQGAGGMKFHAPKTLQHIRHACDALELLMIVDEIATGFGRTGTMFACEQADIAADIVCLGKALTAGTMGMAATVASDRVFEAFLSDEPLHALMHGPTFMANPLACAAANASLDLFETEPRLQQVSAIESAMTNLLDPCQQIPGVVEVRCRGAIGVIQVAELHHVQRLCRRFIERGVWLRPFADMIYLTPPLTISKEELGTLCRVVTEVVQEWSDWR
ncbi:MAG: aminotransferase class III-fold pyridoxal phosphate-dependent enzyme, partial [Planctomycetales bacterium]